MLDFSGEEIRRIACHSAAINDVDIDISGEYVACCADDGKVSILSLFDGSTVEFDFQRPILCVCLSPKYASNKRFAFGRGDQLVMSVEGWFSRSETVVHQGEGSITAIRVRSTSKHVSRLFFRFSLPAAVARLASGLGEQLGSKGLRLPFTAAGHLHSKTEGPPPSGYLPMFLALGERNGLVGELGSRNNGVSRFCGRAVVCLLWSYHSIVRKRFLLPAR